MQRRQFLLIVLFCAFGSVANAQLPPIWSTKFTNLGVAGKVRALLPAHDSLYIGGTFDSVAGMPAHHIALWDGKQWDSLGTGTDLPVNALALDADHTLLAGGEFFHAGGQPANCIARWNGTVWSAMGKGVLPPPFSVHTTARGVQAILVTSTHDIYIGGCLPVNGEQDIINDIAHWNGTKWDTLQFALASLRDADGRHPSVVALVETKWGIAAGGAFIAANFLEGSGIAFWNAGAWAAPIVDTPEHVNVTSMFYDPAGSLVFAGDLSNKWPNYPFVAYNGNGVFAGPPVSPGFPITLVAPVGTTLYAAQSAPCDTCKVHNLAQLYASVWSPVGLGVDSTVNVMISAGTRLYLAGNFTHANGMPSDGIAMYDADPASVPLLSHYSASEPVASIVTTSGRVIVTGKPSEISIFDAVGRRMNVECVATSENGLAETEVNLASVANGLYLISDGEKIVKVLFQR